VRGSKYGQADRKLGRRYNASVFPTTRLSALAADRSSDPIVRELGFSRIADAYWKPIYLYLRLQHGRAAEDASDLTQDFFARAWERETFRSYDPAKGRFRTFVRTCVDRLGRAYAGARSRLFARRCADE